jgi:hypothetical protein
MEHAGFDGLHNPFGAMLVCVALLLITAIIMFGSFMVKMAMQRDKAMRAEMRKAYDESKNH